MSTTQAVASIPLHKFGLLEYSSALKWQQRRVESVRTGRLPECLALLEHPPIYTMGSRGGRKHLLASSRVLATRGTRVMDVDRGGDITFHGPGQLVAYPIMNLRTRRIPPTDYVRSLEATLIGTLDTFGIRGSRMNGKPGVWVAGAKIAALGVRIQRGVASHGIALNVTTDLSWFEAIVPCGMPDTSTTSMHEVLSDLPCMTEVEDTFAASFSKVFEMELSEASTPSQLIAQPVYSNGN